MLARVATPVQINVNNSTAVVWVLSLGFSIIQGANLLLVQYYSMFYPNAWADQRIQQELKSVIAGWITNYGFL